MSETISKRHQTERERERERGIGGDKKQED